MFKTNLIIFFIYFGQILEHNFIVFLVNGILIDSIKIDKKQRRNTTLCHRNECSVRYVYNTSFDKIIPYIFLALYNILCQYSYQDSATTEKYLHPQ